MLGASETPYDLRFTLLGIPVRVHPLFWLVAVVLGFGRNDRNLALVVVWVACVFVSILVHEYGHALMARALGSSPSIVLWGMGGLCYSQAERQTLLQRLAVVLSGPAAGLGLYVLVMLFASGTFGISASENLSVSQATLPGLGMLVSADDWFSAQNKLHNEVYFESFLYLIQINLLWSLFNLLPIWPLDGGQATQILLSLYDRARGPRWGHIVSLLCAGGLAIMAVSMGASLFNALFLAYFAMMNYQMLQTLHQAHSMGIYHEDEWWKR
jgi:stage IV sporulation protein FB